MTRSIAIFAVCFLAGAGATAVLRTVGHDPHASQATASGAVHRAATAAALDPHAMDATAATTAPVNTICAICGMPVDPAVPTATWAGRTIGFGCKACPPRFAAEPEKYGPAALANRVVEE